MKSSVLEQRGHFWWRDEAIPEGHFAPSNFVTGTLRIGSDGCTRLELDGELPSSQDFPQRLTYKNRKLREERAIQGILKDTGQHVLILDAVDNGGAFHSNRFSYSTYFATRCLVGTKAIPKRTSDLRFTSLRIPMSGLEDWLGLGSIEVKRTKRSITAKHTLQPDVSHTLTNATLTLEHFTTGPGRGTSRSDELHLRETMTLILRPKKAMSPGEAREEYQTIQDLITLLSNSNYSLEWPTISLRRSKTDYTFYFQRMVSSAAKPTWQWSPTHYRAIEADFGKIVDQCRMVRSHYGAGFYSYTSTRRDVRAYVENEFSTLAGGLEAFHRTKFPTSKSTEALEAKIARILDDVKLKKDKRWLQEALKNKVEPSLEQRLTELMESLDLNLDAKRMRKFAKKCADRRNDIAHFMGLRVPGDRPQFVLDTSTLSHALGAIYHALLLKEIGLALDDVRAWLFDRPSSFRIKHFFYEAGLLEKSPDES